MVNDKKRYAVVIDTYVYAENDYMARKKAHIIKDQIKEDHTRVIEISECPFGSLNVRELDNISDITYEEDQGELPF